MSNFDVSTPEGLRQRDEQMTARRIPARFRDASPDHLSVRRWCEIAAGSGEAPSLLLTGPTGVGKTWQAYGALRWLAVHHGTEWQAETAADLYAALRPRPGTDSEHEFSRYARCPLLLVDDLAAAKASEWTEEIDYRLVNHRSARMLPTIYTTNLPVRAAGEGARSLETELSERVFSRLAECEIVRLKGADRRRSAA